MTKQPLHIRLLPLPPAPPAAEQAAEPRVTAGKRRAVRGEQLRFELDGSPQEKRVVLVPMSKMHGRRLAEIVGEMRPNIVLDMRHAIRFDLPGTNRSHIFAQFTNVAAFYTTASLPWHEYTPADFMLDRGKLSQRLHHEILERPEDRIMILLPDTLQVTWLRTYLNRRLSEWAKSDWRVEEASATSRL